MISIRMLKICGDSILKPLELIFKLCIENGKFPIKWKKANVVPAHKKNNKQRTENCGPISLLPVCGKILERIIYNKMFEFFSENELINLTINQGSDQGTHALISYYESPSIFINHLMMA